MPDATSARVLSSLGRYQDRCHALAFRQISLLEDATPGTLLSSAAILFEAHQFGQPNANADVMISLIPMPSAPALLLLSIASHFLTITVPL